jgi:hypothetical protein
MLIFNINSHVYPCMYKIQYIAFLYSLCLINYRYLLAAFFTSLKGQCHEKVGEVRVFSRRFDFFNFSNVTSL